MFSNSVCKFAWPARTLKSVSDVQPLADKELVSERIWPQVRQGTKQALPPLAFLLARVLTRFCSLGSRASAASKFADDGGAACSLVRKRIGLQFRHLLRVRAHAAPSVVHCQSYPWDSSPRSTYRNHYRYQGISRHGQGHLAGRKVETHQCQFTSPYNHTLSVVLA